MTGLEWTPHMIPVSAIFSVALYFFISKKIPITVTAIGIIGALALCETISGEVLSHTEVFASFGSSGPLAVVMLFGVSAVLIRNGAQSFVVNSFVKLTRGKTSLLTLLMVCVVIALSAFLNNMPVVIIFISIILMICERFRLVPTRFLTPLSYASILGGTCALIGTSSDIILSDMMVLNGQKAFGFFGPSIVGVPVAIIGGLFLVFIAPRLLLDRKSTFISSGDVHAKTYISELRVLEGGPLAGVRTDDIESRVGAGVFILEVLRGRQNVYLPGSEGIVINPGDELVVDTEAAKLISLLSRKAAVLRNGSELFLSGPKDTHPIAELIVPSNSKARGRRIQNTEVGISDEITILGVMRKQNHYTMQKARQQRFATPRQDSCPGHEQRSGLATGQRRLPGRGESQREDPLHHQGASGPWVVPGYDHRGILQHHGHSARGQHRRGIAVHSPLHHRQGRHEISGWRGAPAHRLLNRTRQVTERYRSRGSIRASFLTPGYSEGRAGNSPRARNWWMAPAVL